MSETTSSGLFPDWFNGELYYLPPDPTLQSDSGYGSLPPVPQDFGQHEDDANHKQMSSAKQVTSSTYKRMEQTWGDDFSHSFDDLDQYFPDPEHQANEDENN
jgi:hypothetical protein